MDINPLPTIDPEERDAPRYRTVYEAVGDVRFRALVTAFYRRVVVDPVLRPMFPDDMEEAKERQYLFLVQFFGGPGRYSEVRGHPRLRLRHMPFPIGQRERDAWLGHMLAAIDEAGIPEPEAEVLRGYFQSTSRALMNR